MAPSYLPAQCGITNKKGDSAADEPAIEPSIGSQDVDLTEEMEIQSVPDKPDTDIGAGAAMETVPTSYVHRCMSVPFSKRRQFYGQVYTGLICQLIFALVAVVYLDTNHAIFPTQSRPLEPEVELGFCGIAVLLVLVSWVLKGCFPLNIILLIATTISTPLYWAYLDGSIFPDEADIPQHILGQVLTSVCFSLIASQIDSSSITAIHAISLNPVVAQGIALVLVIILDCIILHSKSGLIFILFAGFANICSLFMVMFLVGDYILATRTDQYIQVSVILSAYLYSIAFFPLFVILVAQQIRLAEEKLCQEQDKIFVRYGRNEAAI